MNLRVLLFFGCVVGFFRFFFCSLCFLAILFVACAIDSPYQNQLGYLYCTVRQCLEYWTCCNEKRSQLRQCNCVCAGNIEYITRQLNSSTGHNKYSVNCIGLIQLCRLARVLNVLMTHVVCMGIYWMIDYDGNCNFNGMVTKTYPLPLIMSYGMIEQFPYRLHTSYTLFVGHWNKPPLYW